MTIHKLGLTLIKEFEKLRLEVYKDSGDKDTIGWGHLVKSGEEFETITETEADTILTQDLKIAENAVNDLVTVPLVQKMFDSLCSLCYNIGRSNFNRSTLLMLLNQKKYNEVPAQFLRWVYAGGKKLNGLVRRRSVEAKLFQEGIREIQKT